MSDKTEWEVRQSEATGHWYVNTGREIWKCFDEERARLIASAPELRAENEGLRSAYETMRNVADSRRAENERLRAALGNCVQEIQELMAGTTLLSWSVPPARELLGRNKAS